MSEPPTVITRPNLAITLASGAVITIYGLHEFQAQELARRLSGSGRQLVEVLHGTTFFTVRAPGSDELITDFQAAGEYRRVRPSDVVGVEIGGEVEPGE